MRKHKKLKRSQKVPSIDGIVSDGRRLGVHSARSYQPTRGEMPTPSLDGAMSRVEGFNPLRQSQSGLGQSAEAAERELLEEPIVLDEPARPAKAGQRFGSRKIIKKSSLVLLALLIVGAGYFGYKFYITQRHLFRGGGRAPSLAENVDINQLKGEGDGRINILLLGIGGPNHDGPDLTDSIMLVSIDAVNNKAALLSIPRDLWVRIPGDGYQKINAAYAYGKEGSKAKSEVGKKQDGLALLDKTIGPVIGVPIHYHAIVDFTAFKDAVNTVGGVSVNVPEELYDPTIAWENHYNPVIAQKGVQNFDGDKALLYVKSRETSSDFARSQRQRLVLVALKDKALSLGTFSNPVKVSNLLDSFGNNVYTDFSLSDIKRLHQIVNKIPSADITSLDLVTPPHDLLTTGNMNGLSIVRPKIALTDYMAVQSYIRNTLRDGYIAKENASIALYNATSIAGLATAKGDELKSFGYSVSTVANAPNQTNPAQTTIVDYSKGVNKYTRHYLETRYGVSAVSSLPGSFGINPPVGTTFVIIIGKDAASSH